MSSNQFSPEQEAELSGLADMSDEQIDTLDMPERFDWSDAKRGVFYRSLKPFTSPENPCHRVLFSEIAQETNSASVAI
jgi:hypothetical protein